MKALDNVMKYPIPKEVFMFGDAEVAVPTETRKARRACASSRYPFGWMRFDICVDLPKQKKSDKTPSAIRDSRGVSRFFHDSIPFAGRGQELLCLDAKNVPLAVANPHVGGRSSAEVDPVSVMRPVVIANAVSFILAHNHPSQEPAPSSADDAITQKLREIAKLLHVNFLDHVVLTDNPDKFYSYLDAGRMPK